MIAAGFFYIVARPDVSDLPLFVSLYPVLKITELLC